MAEIEVRELRYFIAVGEDLNFTRAAARLGMAQPPLSAAIGKLERKLGVRLLTRSSRQVSLTEAGAAFLAEARGAVLAVDAAIARTRRQARAGARLTVAVKAGSGTELLGDVLRQPDAPEADVVFGHPDGPAGAVRGGAADLALARLPFDQRGLDVELLRTEPRVAVLPAEHRLAGRRELCRADLAGEPIPRWAGRQDPAAAAHWTGADTPAPDPFDPARHPLGQLTPPRGPEINDMNQLLDAVALGNAVAFVPGSFAARQRRPELVFRPVRDLSPSRLVVAWAQGRRSPEVGALVRLLCTAYSSGEDGRMRG